MQYFLPVLLAGAALAAAPVSAATSLVAVFGNDNPFLAGAANGTSCCGGDQAPDESPTLFTGFAPGSVLTFSATGFTNGAGFGNVGPDGTAASFNMTDFNTGIAPARGVGVNALLGVFLTDAAPTPGAEPASLEFLGNRNFGTLAPGIAQIFYIGDGLTGTGSGSVQQFTAPAGATRLFLGVADGFGWFNNQGTLDVTITFTPADGTPSPIPEPASWALMITGFGLIGTALRRRARNEARV